ncbi:chemotaxis protein CheW [Indiicoccus explosivorum]|uniref:chemotaxis protein CheW n=1 Tax=Indiicoccus explosivorum TaxID=1917864 RepID=UPI000B4411AF|nr:chemotaxis protein CheW [Indiicoccus explosivorum]
MAETAKMIVFRLNSEQYGAGISQVRSIERLENVTEVPRTPEFIKGVINLRGVITPVIDLKERLALHHGEAAPSCHVLIITIDETQVGLIVDEVLGVQDMDESVIDPAPAMIGGVSAEYLEGIAKLEDRLLILLDLKKLLNKEEVNQAQEVIVG